MIATYFFGALAIISTVGFVALLIYNHYVKKHNKRLNNEV